jgi:hypothetical protein
VVSRARREEPPFAGNAFQLADAAILERNPRAGDEILDGARNEHLSGLRLRRNAGADVDGDARHLAVDELAFARVQACAYIKAELAHGGVIADAQRIARAGPSKEAKNPSPSVSTSTPRKRSSCRRTSS